MAGMPHPFHHSQFETKSQPVAGKKMALFYWRGHAKKTELRSLLCRKTDFWSKETGVGKNLRGANAEIRSISTFSDRISPERALTTAGQTLYNGSCRLGNIQHVVLRPISIYNLCRLGSCACAGPEKGKLPMASRIAVSSYSSCAVSRASGRAASSFIYTGRG